MLALIGTARYETLLRRLLSTKGSEAAPLLSPEIQPVIVVQGDAPELDFLRGVRRWGAQGLQGAVAGQISGQTLNNPVGSSVMLIVEQIMFSMTGGFLVSLGDATLGLGTPVAAGNQRPYDTRLTNVVASAATLNNVAQVGGFISANIGWQTTPEALSHTIRNPGIVIAPGTAWGIGTPVNTQVRSSWIWRERALEQSEEG